jgi:probable F420-dependent oxidoreductase
MKFAQAVFGADVEHHVDIAVAAEAAGFDAIAISDHVVHPEVIESEYPYTPDGKPFFPDDADWPDPWVHAAFMAARTERIKFFTNVYVLPARNPFVVAKAVGTLACLSNNRVMLGIGVGWMREEFELLGQSFEQRGSRTDESIEVLHKIWTGDVVEHHGKHFAFDRLHMKPVPTERVPVLVGGHSEVALRRAARNDGWIGVYYDLDTLERYCERLLAYRAESGLGDAPFEVIASPMVLPIPENVERLEKMGVTTILTSAWMLAGHQDPTREQALETIAEFGQRYIAPLRG